MLITNLLEQRSFYGRYTELSNNLLGRAMKSEWRSRGWLMVLHFWRGGYSLGLSFWAFGIVGLPLIHVLIAGLFKLINDPSLLLILAMGALGFAYQVWISVGIWRSAGRHPGMGLYVYGARIAIVILGVYSIALLSLTTMMLMLGGAVLLNPPFIK